jgi:hypothetical protein
MLGDGEREREEVVLGGGKGTCEAARTSAAMAAASASVGIFVKEVRRLPIPNVTRRR